MSELPEYVKNKPIKNMNHYDAKGDNQLLLCEAVPLLVRQNHSQRMDMWNNQIGVRITTILKSSTDFA